MIQHTTSASGGNVSATERHLDLQFYRAAYDDAEGLSDEELLYNLNTGFAANRAINPVEFVQQALANRLLPKNFDPIGYRIHRPELWGPDVPVWKAVLHYLKIGQHEDIDRHRPFDADFYRELYLDVPKGADHEGLLADYRRRPHAYGSVAEVLVRNGWSSRDWIDAFDHQSYAIYNSLTEKLKTPTQRLAHFAEYGWQQLFPLSADQEPDWAYYTDLVGQAFSPTIAYRIWVEKGLKAGAAINERQHLRRLGLDLNSFPKSFDWRTYMEESGVNAGGAGAARWVALEHLLEHGLRNPVAPLPIDIQDLSSILIACATRFTNLGQWQEAEQCYDRALLDNPDPSPRLLSEAAFAAIRRNQYARALPLLRLAIDKGATGLRLFKNIAETALRFGLLDEATDAALKGFAKYPRNVELNEVFVRIQHKKFSCAISKHIADLRSGRKASDVDKFLDSILDAFTAAHYISFGNDKRPSRDIKADRMRIVILSNNDLPQCKFYRVDLKWQQLNGLDGVNLQVFDCSDYASFCSAASTADIAIFYRVSSSVEVLQCIAMCRLAAVPTVYEVDDLVFDATAFPDTLDSYSGALSPEQHFDLRAGVALVRHAVKVCDAAIASTDRLAGQMQTLVRTNAALTHRNGLSNALVKFASAAPTRAAFRNKEEVVLFYGSGTLAHGRDFRTLLLPALMRLMANYPQVRVIACGHVEARDLASHFPTRVELVPIKIDRDAYLAQFINVDLNIAVLTDNEFNRCKSEIKWLEAAAFGVPSIVSDVEGYRETLVDGVHVVRVAAEPDAWYTGLRDLILDQPRRVKIGEAARERALELYTPQMLGKVLVENLRASVFSVPGQFPDLKRRRRPRRMASVATSVSSNRKSRLLLVNVFFPPQTIGGATRVVRDQAAEIISRYSTRFEIGILCGNNEETAPYQVETYTWRNAPVWSISSPHREHMDWIPFDEHMSVPLDMVLDRFQPDLVHVHCIQRLSATLLLRVAERNIPYVVTAHDAWWISDHQFLTDGQGRLRMPWDKENYETAYNLHRRADSLARRLHLRQILDAASAVLVVSQAFAEIYRRAGIRKAVALPNGVPELPPLVQTPTVSGRVRLAHLGGVNSYKGYFRLRQAIARGQYSNIDLLVVDHAMEVGQQRHEVWGTTPVLIVPRVEQEKVGTLYGQFDVLCALSLWPESYGLVTREAHYYGKWVIASSLGAIGEDVIPEENGWVIDPFEPERLERVLTDIDNNPGRYAAAPNSLPFTRTVAQQVDKLIDIYDRICLERQVPTL